MSSKSGKKSRRKGVPHPSALQGIYAGEGMVVSVAYAMWDHAGRPVDSGNIGEPLTFLFGSADIPSVIQEALRGHERADRVQLSTLHWSEHRPEDTLRLAVSGEPPLGFPYTYEGRVGRVVESSPGHVVVDFNHPLAGTKVRINLLVVAVRPATTDELRLGQVIEECA